MGEGIGEWEMGELVPEWGWRRDLYLAARPNRRNGLITIWCDSENLAYTEPPRRARLSAAAKTLVYYILKNIAIKSTKL